MFLKPTKSTICYTENMNSLSDYLQPTRLCDFDQAPEIRETAEKLRAKLTDRREVCHSIYQFVRGLPYGLENWDIRASETLRKGWGMCSGKTNLLVAMLRSVGIPARYRIYRIKSENMLWRWIASQDKELARQMGEPLQEQDHIIAETHLNGWEACDPARDPAFEAGLKKLDIPLERKPVTNTKGNPNLLILASIDDWAQNRQQARRFKENRELIFSEMNKQFDRIRLIGKEKD